MELDYNVISYKFWSLPFFCTTGLKLDTILLRGNIPHWLKLDNSTIPHFAIVLDSMRLMKNSLYFQPSLIKSITLSVALQSHECQGKTFVPSES